MEKTCIFSGILKINNLHLDANTEDGDKINLSINDKTIYRKTQKKKKKITQTNGKTRNKNCINVGENPPNTNRN